MENVMTFIIGVLLIILSVLWFLHERKKCLNKRDNSDYIGMSFRIEFLFGALILLAIGFKLIYNSCFA